ncbi:hypothetical protein EDB85DRAFT_2155941 [Lactarius pseudohatsudake]|nr:hypothetical protein EDB85DRAFT_2155941 [Lactarius pseudohatsudake]
MQFLQVVSAANHDLGLVDDNDCDISDGCDNDHGNDYCDSKTATMTRDTLPTHPSYDHDHDHHDYDRDHDNHNQSHHDHRDCAAPSHVATSRACLRLPTDSVKLTLGDGTIHYHAAPSSDDNDIDDDTGYDGEHSGDSSPSPVQRAPPMMATATALTTCTPDKPRTTATTTWAPPMATTKRRRATPLPLRTLRSHTARKTATANPPPHHDPGPATATPTPSPPTCTSPAVAPPPTRRATTTTTVAVTKVGRGATLLRLPRTPHA